MENDKFVDQQQQEFNKYRKDAVHFLLAHSYLIFLLSIIIGVFLDLLLSQKMFSNSAFSIIGFILMTLGSFVVIWAQRTYPKYKKWDVKNFKRSGFEMGPYRYFRSPTHLGLFVLTLGFGLVINSFFSVILTIMAHVITKTFFLKREEKILEDKYGDAYTLYKKKVKNWL